MLQIIEQKLGPIGNLISYSKSNYRNKFPDNIIVFNSNLIVNGKKIWYGDLDVTKSKNDLIDLSYEINETIYILYERDGRFENEFNPNLHNYVVKIDPDGKVDLHKRLSEYYNI